MGTPLSTQQPGAPDMTALALLQRYFDIRDKSVWVGGGAWGDALLDLVQAANGVIVRAQRLQNVLGAPAWVKHEPAVQWLPGGVYGTPPNRTGRGDAEGTWYTREPVASTPYMLQALQVGQEMRDALVAQHGNDAAGIIDTALSACGPERSKMLTDERIAAVKADLLAALGNLSGISRNQAAQRILHAAIADKNAPVLYTMLSGPLNNLYLGWGDVSVKTLQKVYAQATAKANDSLKEPSPAPIALVALQDTPFALANLVPAACEVFDYYMSASRALIRS